MIRDIDISGLASVFPTQLTVGKNALINRLSAPQTDSQLLAERIAEIRTVRRNLKTHGSRVEELLGILQKAESDCKSVLNIIKFDSLKVQNTDRNAEYYSQLLWDRTSILSPLNENPLWCEASLFLRSLFLPGLSVAVPILLVVAPIVILYLTKDSNTDIDISSYLASLRTALQQTGKLRYAGRGDTLEFAEQFGQIAGAIAMMLMSAWNQVSAAQHLRNVAEDMKKQANSVYQMASAIKEIATLLDIRIETDSLRIEGGTSLTQFGYVWNHPQIAQNILNAAGHIDMLIAIASFTKICTPIYSNAGIELIDLYHPVIASESRIYNSVHIKNHMILTGPNRGGKSTLLKSICYAVLMSQTIGIVFARKAVLPIFGNIVCALNPIDRVGEVSLFEAEIEFAKSVRTIIAKSSQPVFIMMDEIFHGTNAHDGVEASQIFLDDLYAHKQQQNPVISVISTHYLELPRRYCSGVNDEGTGHSLNTGENNSRRTTAAVTACCMEASPDPRDSDCLVYSYRLIPGINRFSSVREILRERGLLAEKSSMPATE